MVRADKTDAKTKVRMELCEPILRIRQLIGASPENTVRLLEDVVQFLLAGVASDLLGAERWVENLRFAAQALPSARSLGLARAGGGLIARPGGSGRVVL